MSVSKNIKILFLLLPLSIMGYAQEKYRENDRKLDLKGNVKTCTETIHREKFKTCEIAEYDSLGNLAAQQTFNSKDSLTSYFICEFDKNNQIKKQVDLVSGNTWSYTYNDNKIAAIIKKDKKGKKTNMIALQYTGDLMTSESTLDASGICRKYDYKYDKKKRVIEESEKSCSGRLESIIEYIYDDSDSTVTEKTYNGDEKFMYTVVTKYNNQGNEIYSIIDDIAESEAFFQYEYDTHNNWIRQYCILSNEKKLTHEREITYY